MSANNIEAKYAAILTAETRGVESAKVAARRVARAVMAYLIADTSMKADVLAKQLASDTGTSPARWRQIISAAVILNSASQRPDDETVSAVLAGTSNGTPVGALKDAVTAAEPATAVTAANDAARTAKTAKRETNTALGKSVTPAAFISAVTAITTGKANTSKWSSDEWTAVAAALTEAARYAEARI